MDRYFEVAKSATPPLAPPASPGYPTNGNPQTATPATEPGDWWFYMVTEELRNVIATAGITPDHAAVNQLALAIQALIAAGLANDFKTSVRIATTANLAAFSGLAAVDGVTPIAGDRILVKDQATGSQNGIYVAAAGAWSRATDADTGAELNGGALVSVEEGTTNAETIWALANDGAVTIGTTALVFQWAAGLKGVTAAQFDDSRLLATTAFVQRSLGNFRGFDSVSANVTLTAADIGKSYEVAHASTAFAVTMPIADNSVPNGGALYFRNDNSAAVTIQRQSTDQFHMGNGLVTSFILQRGDDVWLMKGATGYWYCIGGTVKARYSDGDFGKSLSSSGYQKLPSGLIIQWGSWLASGTAGNPVAVTFPIAFSSACYAVFPAVNYSTTITQSGWYDTPTTTGFNGRSSITSNGVNYIAIGK